MNRKLSLLSLMFALYLAATAAVARDDHNMYSLEDALNTPGAKEKLDPSIRLYFGAQKTPKVVKEHGEWRTNKKTNGFGKSDKTACEWVLLSALLELQERARKEGGNAVIHIKSNYKNIERSSETEYMCGSGALMSGVALKGVVAEVAK
ncbi:MAG: excinuclease ABC subunit A [Ignavibacteria bacterium]